MHIERYYEVVTDESAANGEAAERGSGDDVSVTGVADAISFLKGEGPLTPSSSPGFSRNIWYTGPVVQDARHFRTGENTTWSYHLKGFTDEQLEVVWNAVVNNVEPTLEQLVGKEAAVGACSALAGAVRRSDAAANPGVVERLERLEQAVADGEGLMAVLACGSNLVQALADLAGKERQYFSRLEADPAYDDAVEAVRAVIADAYDGGFDATEDDQPLPSQVSGLGR